MDELTPSERIGCWARLCRRLIQALYPEENWLAELMIAIARLESGNGRAYPSGSNNLIGYHWTEGCGYPYVEAKETGTGKTIRYRKFADPANAALSLVFVLRYSSLEEYMRARSDHAQKMILSKEALEVARKEEVEARKAFIEAFSRGYCPGNEDYARQIMKMMPAKIVEDTREDI